MPTGKFPRSHLAASSATELALPTEESHGPIRGMARTKFVRQTTRLAFHSASSAGRVPVAELAARWLRGNFPVGIFPPNGYGLFDMAGNVWNGLQTGMFTAMRTKSSNQCCGPSNNPRIASPDSSYDPRQPSVPHSSESCQGRLASMRPQLLPALPPAARQPQMIDTSMSHIAFDASFGHERTGRVLESRELEPFL